MNFTITYTAGPFVGPAGYNVVFNSPRGENKTLWFVDSLNELSDRVREWETDPPLFGYSIKTIERSTLRPPAIMVLKNTII